MFKINWFYLCILILLLVIVLLSYGQTVDMFYWIDDWGLVFNMIYPSIFPGNFGHPAYRYATTPFAFLYPIAGLNSYVYFTLALFQYYIATVLVFITIKLITKNNLIAIYSAIIFGSGYIGSYAMYRLSNSFQLVETTIFMLITLCLLYLFYTTNKVINYVFTLTIFTATLEFFFLRSQGLLLIVIASSLFIISLKFKLTDLKDLLLKIVPFVVIYYFFFFIDERVRPRGNSASDDALRQTLNTLFVERNFELLDNLVISIVNTIIPQNLIVAVYTNLPKYLSSMHILDISTREMIVVPGLLLISMIAVFYFKSRTYLKPSLMIILASITSTGFVLWSSIQTYHLWSPNPMEIFTASVGLQMMLFLVWFYIIFRRTEKVAAKLLLLGLVWVFAVVIPYYIYSPFTSLDSVSRYLIPGFVGSSIIYGALLYLVPKLFGLSSKHSIIFSMVFMLIVSQYFIGLGRTEQRQIVTNISNPSRIGFDSLQKELSGATTINQNTLFHFEIVDDPVLRGNILGGMPHIAVSIAAGFNDGAKIADSYEHIFYLLKSGRSKLEDINTFFVSKNEFINTTNKFRSLLNNENNVVPINEWKDLKETTVIASDKDGSVGINPSIEVSNLSQNSLTPNELILKMKIEPLDISSRTLPYYDYSKQYAKKVDERELTNIIPSPITSFSEENILYALKEERGKRYVQKYAKVTATTESKTTEAINLIDGRLDTNWSAYDANWNLGQQPVEVILDLGRSIQISKVVWVNHYTQATPTSYTISYANDPNIWIESSKKNNGGILEGKTVVTEILGNINARFIKMSIFDTYGGLGYPPAIDEIWTSNSDEELEPILQTQIIECPFCFITNKKQALEVTRLVSELSQAKISWTTDRSVNFTDKNSLKFDTFADGQEHAYRIYLPAQGRNLKSLKIDNFLIPSKVTISSATLKALSLEELINGNLIKNYGKE